MRRIMWWCLALVVPFHAAGEVVICGSASYPNKATIGTSVYATGDVNFGNDATVDGSVTVDGDLIFGNDGVVRGGVSAGGSFVGGNAFQGGTFVAAGDDVDLANSCQVAADVVARTGDANIGNDANVGGTVSARHGDVNLGNDATVDGVVAGGDVNVGNRCTSTHRIVAKVVNLGNGASIGKGGAVPRDDDNTQRGLQKGCGDVVFTQDGAVLQQAGGSATAISSDVASLTVGADTTYALVPGEKNGDRIAVRELKVTGDGAAVTIPDGVDLYVQHLKASGHRDFNIRLTKDAAHAHFTGRQHHDTHNSLRCRDDTTRCGPPTPRRTFWLQLFERAYSLFYN